MRCKLINLQVWRKILLRPSFSVWLRKGLDGKHISGGSRACVKELKTHVTGASAGQTLATSPHCNKALTVDSLGQEPPWSQQLSYFICSVGSVGSK